MPEGKYFKIRSELSGLVMDVRGAGTDDGTDVIMWEEKGEGEFVDNQIWFVHPLTKSIRSKMDPELCLDTNGESCVTSSPLIYNLLFTVCTVHEFTCFVFSWLQTTAF